MAELISIMTRYGMSAEEINTLLNKGMIRDVNLLHVEAKPWNQTTKRQQLL